jgi:hypothetical protein
MKKQTAVEWLIKNLCDRMYIHCPEFGHTIIDELVDEAKAMELQQKLQFARAYLSCNELSDKIKEIEKPNAFSAQMNMMKKFATNKQSETSKKSAVQWLQDTWGNYPDLWSWEKIQEWFEQAKEMERIHIIYAYDDGANERHNDPVTGEDYYNETYGGDK